MKRITSYILLTLLLSGFLVSQDLKKEIVLAPDKTGISVLKDDDYSLQLKSTLKGFQMFTHHTPEGNFARIFVEGYTNNYNTGYPELPVLNKMFEIPQEAEPIVRILSYEEEIIHLEDFQVTEKVFPSQPSLSKNIRKEDIQFEYNSAFYKIDQFTDKDIVSFEELGTTRGIRLGQVQFAPFHYNPVKNIIKIYNNLVVEIVFYNSNHELTQSLKKKYYSPVFEKTFSKILNYKSESAKYVLSEKPVKYVILSDTMFKSVLKPFIEWKTKKGFNVVEVYKGDPGVGTTRDEMKTYLKNLYLSSTPEDPAPTYLLLVGDVGQIPSSQASGQLTDLYYAEYDGNGDYFPEVFYGRFSARDTNELIIQINKTLEYEQYLFPDPSFLDTAVMIAGVDGSHSYKWCNGQINYGTQNYFNPEHGLTSHTYLYPESGSSDAQIIQDVSNGVGFVNYTGHGFPDRWDDPRFSITHIQDLQNTGKYPLMIGNACSTTRFDNPECFAEALVRAENKGALAYIGCTNDSYWDEDFYWVVGVGPISANPTYDETGLGAYDRIFHDNGEPVSEWYITQGQMVYAGNLAVTTGNIQKAKYYWETYQLMGDPSLMVYFSVPDTLEVYYPLTIPIGMNTLFIHTEPNAYIGFTFDGQLLDAKHADESGSVILSFPELTGTGFADLIVTKQNREPFINTIDIIQNNEPYVIYEGHFLNDSLGNSDNKADYGEVIYVNMTIKNLGNINADSVSVTISAMDSLVTITDSLEHWILVPALSDSTILNAFLIEISDTINDQHVTTFRMDISDKQENNWTSYFKITLYAPVLEIGKITINDNEEGNGNGNPDPGERIIISIETINDGNSDATNVTGVLTTANEFITIDDSLYMFGDFEAGTADKATYTITIDSSAPYASLVKLQFKLMAGFYSVADSFELPVGLVYENFETGGFKQYPWSVDTIRPWEISQTFSYDGDFSARSGQISHNQFSMLSITVNVFSDDTVTFRKKVSSESGYDFLTFYIDSIETDYWSGEKGWTKESYPVSEGTHTLKWIYTKDSNVSKGYDRAWIDCIVFPRYSFSGINTGIAKLNSPVSDFNLTGHENINIDIKNYGSDTINHLYVSCQISGSDLVTDTISSEIFPDSIYNHSFSIPADLSEFGQYTLTIYTSLENDEFRGNDTLTTIIENYPTIDAGIINITSPEKRTTYTDAEEITVWIKNFGTVSVSGITVFYVINDTVPVEEIMNTTLNPEDSLAFTFNQTADLSDYKTYEIMVYTSLGEDTIFQNDTVYLFVEHKYTGPNIPEFNILIYPNPCNEEFCVAFKSLRDEEIMIKILSLSGKTLFQKKCYIEKGYQQIYINMKEFKAGIYILNIRTSYSSYTGKIIKN
ncbi:MAG: T9SS type A sorting domain-containing protein [Bacteroidales bacterium]|nr:T9SS type A sorting domain-containing protein [Bacteroidales bacterium]